MKTLAQHLIETTAVDGYTPVAFKNAVCARINEIDAGQRAEIIDALCMVRRDLMERFESNTQGAVAAAERSLKADYEAKLKRAVREHEGALELARKSHKVIADNLHAAAKSQEEHLTREIAMLMATIERAGLTVDGNTKYEVAPSSSPGCNQDGSESGTGRFKPKKPPLGLRPQYIADGERLEEINAAIGRYLDYGQHVPFEWYQEQKEIQERQKAREAAKEKKSNIAKTAARTADDCLKSLGIYPSMEVNERSHNYRHAMEDLTAVLIQILTKQG